MKKENQSNVARTTLEQRIGAELSARRTALGISKYQMQRITGVHYGYLTQLESGERSMSVDMLGRLCEALDLEICLAPKKTAPQFGGE